MRGGLAFPVVASAALLVYTLIIGEARSHDAPPEPLRVAMTDRQTWWEVRYGARVLANEVRVPLGRPVEVLLFTRHGSSRLRIPGLAVDAGVPDGRGARITITAMSTGVYPAADGRLAVIAATQADFDEWLARQAAPSVVPTDPLLQDGREAFFRSGCERCHAIRGTGAHGGSGPDLTHVASRRSLAMDSLDDHLRRFVRGRTETPAGRALERRETRAVASYLASLK